MAEAVRATLYVVVLAAAAVAVVVGSAGARVGRRAGRVRIPRPHRRPWATIVSLVVVGVPTLAQFTVAPFLLAHLQRNWTLIGRGQGWRLFSSLLVQDGGIGGAVFNLVSLAVVGVVAEEVWGARRWTAIALTAGVGAQFWGKIVQPAGAGNSVAVFGLAASLAARTLVRGAGRQRILALISLTAGAALLVLADLHGGAVAIGALLGLGFADARRPPKVSDQ